MAFFKNNFWGEKNTGFDVLYHNMKHGQIATKELAEFVRERAAIEETYSKSMSKLAKMASNGSQLGTFAPMWDLFRVSSDKLALCHLELMRKMNDLIRDINKYGDDQVRGHRKTKEEVVGTLEAIQALQVQSGQLQKFREAYQGKCMELDRQRREGAPHKELEKAELKSKKAAESFGSSVEKYNRAGGEFERKMKESAQKFQEIEEAHLRQMKLLIKSYSHSIEDTHVQVGQVHAEFKQNVENIGIETLLQKFAEQKGTGKDKPAPAGFEEYCSNLVPEGCKKTRGKSFRIPGLGKKDKEAGSTDLAVTKAPNSHQVDEEGFVIRADVNQDDCSQEKETNFYSSDSDFDDDEPKKFQIRIQPVGSGGQGNSAASELELRATVGALTLPPNRGVSVKRHLFRNSSCTVDVCSEGAGDGAPHRDNAQDRVGRSAPSPDHSRLNSTASASEVLFGPPLESAFADATFSSDSSSPENVEDSGLDSPSHQPIGSSPEPSTWAAWPAAMQSKDPAGLGRSPDPFLTAFGDPSLERTPATKDDRLGIWAPASQSTHSATDMAPTVVGVPTFGRPLRPLELEPPVWSCKHLPPKDPFLASYDRTASPEPQEIPGSRTPHFSRDGRGPESRRDLLSVSLGNSRTFPASSSSCSSSSFSSSSSHQRDGDGERAWEVPALGSPEDPFSITIIGSPTHKSSLAAAAGRDHGNGHSNDGRPTPGSKSSSSSQPKKELVRWNSVHNPFSEGMATGAPVGAGTGAIRDDGRKQPVQDGEPRSSGLPLRRHSGPQADLCFSADVDQSCLTLSTQTPCNTDNAHYNTDLPGPKPATLTTATTRHRGTPPPSQRESTEQLVVAPPRPARAKTATGRLTGGERPSYGDPLVFQSRSVCSSPLPDHSPSLTSSSSSSSTSDWGGQTYTPRAPSPTRGLSRGPSPISLSTHESWPVAAAVTEYINAYFKGGEHNRCLVKISGELTMSFPAGITRIFTANPNVPVLCFRLVNTSRVDHFLPNQKLLYSDPSQSDPDTKDFWFNMQAISFHLQREAELNPQASYYNVGLLKYQVSSQDPGSAPLLLSAECQRSGTVTRVSLDYHCCPATAPAAQLTGVQVLLPLDHTATDVQCQPPASWNSEERRLLWKLPNLSPTNHSKGSGTLCASWQCLEAPRGPPPSLGVQFVGSGASLSGMDVELVGSRYRMSMVKKRFATGKYMAACSL